MAKRKIKPGLVVSCDMKRRLTYYEGHVYYRYDVTVYETLLDGRVCDASFSRDAAICDAYKHGCRAYLYREATIAMQRMLKAIKTKGIMEVF